VPPESPMRLISRTLLFTALAVSTAAAQDWARPGGKAVPAAAASETRDTAIFAGGSFWCLEQAFETLTGVDSATAGYMEAEADAEAREGLAGQDPAGRDSARRSSAGVGSHPDFESVSAGNSPYVEAVRVIFHPKRIAYAKLLEAFWKSIDPTRADGQFSDEGAQFRTLIFYRNEDQRKAAEASRRRLSRSRRFAKPVLTGIAPAAVFHDAEAEHQDYYKRNAPRYQTYVRFSGREAFFKKAWGGGKGAAEK
jgi:methionine-S-sulfoxide reductase